MTMNLLYKLDFIVKCVYHVSILLAQPTEVSTFHLLASYQNLVSLWPSMLDAPILHASGMPSQRLTDMATCQ
jgi:hypothetical protein